MRNINCNCHVDSYRKNQRTDEEEGCYNVSDKPLGLTGTYTFSYTYPLSTEASFTHKLTSKMSARDILVFGRDDYRRIYREEDSSLLGFELKDVGKATGHIPGMLNRDESDGRYGIWGHDIGDLFFETITINVNKQTVEFSIGS